jgi:hypothetical protein
MNTTAIDIPAEADMPTMILPLSGFSVACCIDFRSG